jgi:glycosyltransferase involved in cell wall biosynthesis
MTDKPTPLVTIVTPSLNQGRFIEDTIRSVAAQDYPRIEHVVCDGGSTDQTLTILERHQGGGRLRYTSAPDGGQSAAINQGFASSRGDIVTWLNSDDAYVAIDAVSTVVRTFAAHPDVDFIFGDFVEIDQNNTVQRVFLRPGFSRERLLRLNYISQPTTFFRRRVVDQLQLDESLRYAMDLDYWLRASAAGFRFLHIRKIIAAERLHEHAKGVGQARHQRAEASLVREKYGHRFDRRDRLMRTSDKVVLAAYGLASLWPLMRSLRPANRALAFELRRAPLLKAWMYQLRLRRDA